MKKNNIIVRETPEEIYNRSGMYGIIERLVTIDETLEEHFGTNRKLKEDIDYIISMEKYFNKENYKQLIVLAGSATLLGMSFYVKEEYASLFVALCLLETIRISLMSSEACSKSYDKLDNNIIEIIKLGVERTELETYIKTIDKPKQKHL